MRLLLTEKWIEAVPLMRILCFAWIWWPASNMSWQLLNAKHRSDYCLKAEIIKKTIAVSLLVFSLFWGIKAVCVGILMYYVTDVYVMTLFTKRILPKVTFIGEMKELLPILIRAMLMGVGVYLFRYMIDSDIVLIAIGMIAGIMLYAVVSLLTGSREACYLMDIAKVRINL